MDQCHPSPILAMCSFVFFLKQFQLLRSDLRPILCKENTTYKAINYCFQKIALQSIQFSSASCIHTDVYTSRSVIPIVAYNKFNNAFHVIYRFLIYTKWGLNFYLSNFSACLIEGARARSLYLKTDMTIIILNSICVYISLLQAVLTFQSGPF